MRSVLTAAMIGLFLVSTGGNAQTPAAEVNVKLGVRTDTRPFIWKDEDSGEYLGFFWDICTEAIHRAGYQFKVVEFNTSQRAYFLESGAGAVDFLCDPTTITLQRLQNFSNQGSAENLNFTPIIFVANSSYVLPERGATFPVTIGELPELAPDNPSCTSILEWVDHQKTATKDRPRHPWEADEAIAPTTVGVVEEEKGAAGWIAWFSRNIQFTLQSSDLQVKETKQRFQIWGYVEGSTIGAALEAWLRTQQNPGTITCTRVLASHTEAATEFCQGGLSRYYGDVDIVRAALHDYRDRMRKECPADMTPTEEGTYEPYAFVVSSASIASLPEEITFALYGMFEDGTIERLFTGHFPETLMSGYLSTLFRINSIPAGAPSPAMTATSGGQ